MWSSLRLPSSFFHDDDDEAEEESGSVVSDKEGEEEASNKVKTLRKYAEPRKVNEKEIQKHGRRLLK